MNSRQIECFLVTAKLLNFTKAAETLYLPQPAVSRYISSLEKELGAELFLRENNRKVMLSDAGKVYFNLFQRFSSEFSSAKKHLADSASALRLGYNTGWNLSAFLPDIVRKCQEVQPDFHLSFECLGFQGLVSALEDRKLDAILTTEDYLEKEADVEGRRVTSIRRTIIFSDLLRDAQHLSDPGDFYDYDFFIVDDPKLSEQYEEIERVFRPYQFFPRFITVPNLETVIAHVENGLGVTILDGWFQNIHSPGMRHVDLDEFLPISLGWRKHTNDPTLTLLLDAMLEYFRHTQEEQKE